MTSGRTGGGKGSGQKQFVVGRSAEAKDSEVMGGGNQIWRIERLKGRSLELIFCKQTESLSGDNLVMRYWMSSTRYT